MKASLARHIDNVHKELDEIHETEALEKRKREDREENEEKIYVTLQEHNRAILVNEGKLEKVTDSIDKLQPVLSSLAKQQRQLREKLTR